MENTFAERLKALRKQRSKTQQQVAIAIRMSRSAVLNYEMGDSKPSNDVLLRIAKYYNVSTDYLLEGNILQMTV